MKAKKIRFDSLVDMLGFQLRRATAIIHSAFEVELKSLRLRVSEATILIGLAENPGRTQAQLGRDLHIRSANLVPIVRHLASLHLIERMPGQGRAIALHLTSKGELLVAKVRELLWTEEERIARHLSVADKALVLKALKGITKSPRPDVCE